MNGHAQSDTGLLVRVLVKRVRDAFGSPAEIAQQWRGLNYVTPPDLDRAAAEQDQFLELLQSRGAAIEFLPDGPETGMDSLYVRDASILSDHGAILCSMGKLARRGEPESHRRHLEKLGLPIVGAITGPGTVEGGDVAWIDPRTLAVGNGYRTNPEGIRQLRELLGDAIDELIEVPLPHWKGPNDVFHLMSFLSPIDPDLALVYSPLMPVPFRRLLLDRGYQLVEVPVDEFDTLGCNSLAIGPRTCLLPAGNPITRRRLEAAGVEVLEFPATEICLKGGGGPTCMTRTLEWHTVPANP